MDVKFNIDGEVNMKLLRFVYKIVWCCPVMWRRSAGEFVTRFRKFFIF